MQTNMTLNSKCLTKTQLHENMTSRSIVLTRLSIIKHKNISQNFVHAIKKNYEAVESRLKQLGNNTSVEFVTKMKYKDLIEHVYSSHGNYSGSTIKASPRIAKLSQLELNGPVSMIANHFNSKVEGVKVDRTVPQAILIKKAAVGKQNLQFLALAKQDLDKEAKSRDRLLNVFIIKNKRPSKSQNDLKIDILRPPVIKKQATAIEKENYNIRPFELLSEDKPRNLCDFYINNTGKLYNNTNESNRLDLRIPHNTSPTVIEDELFKDIDDEYDTSFKHKMNSIMRLSSCRRSLIIESRCRRVFTKDKGLALAQMLRSGSNRKIARLSRMLATDVLSHFEPNEVDKSKNRLSATINSKQLNTGRKLKRTITTKPMETVRFVKKSEEANIATVKSVWMQIVNKLLDTYQIDNETNVGYYEYFRLVTGEPKNTKRGFIEHLTNKLRLDMENEKKFEFNFRNRE